MPMGVMLADGLVPNKTRTYYWQCLPASSASPSSAATSTGTSATSKPATTTTPITTTTLASSSSTSSTSSSATLTGIAATAPTTPPSKLTGRLPALGWNSWNAYGCNINETKVTAAANQFISLGLKDAGYEYVNIDDCWALMARDSATGKIVPDPAKFPNGLTSVSSQVHDLGLKFGIYSDAGTATCAGFPGSLGNENLDASTFSSWGVDYLKYDNCNPVPGNDEYNSNTAIRYRQMGAELAVQANPIQFSLCIWGVDSPWLWGSRVGHSWRMSGDSSASWSYITSIINLNAQYLDYVTFFSHNDMDMMEIGNGDLTIEEQRTHFAAWAFMKSPILLGTDLSTLSTDQLAIIKNTELLAFSQDDTVGEPAKPFTPDGATATSPPSFYVGKSSKGTHVFIINFGNDTSTMSFDFASAGISGTSFQVHDMWAGKDLGTASETYSVSIASHDTAAFLITSA
ncbi:glycoside hydrolase [Punctularia strigosozonata HHB-11173 SS5]|uniref:glycoside hydrolase n=1 Tax=Punctularia strigosozonata (strain HHB-11173) TaxID=741275 RepID=UPI0004417921|nr:glycoside hydrolase [Punctularia strigosozonata HHB-11173 SS5]EIN11673.1 glycoside hydrolase [Punctularia strigosozonata HHB-11173 SS5]